MWSSWPCVSTMASMSSRRSRSEVKSGRITSMPGWVSSGKRTPQSTTSSLPLCSKSVMLRPTSPSPPSGVMRMAPRFRGCGFLRSRACLMMAMCVFRQGVRDVPLALVVSPDRRVRPGAFCRLSRMSWSACRPGRPDSWWSSDGEELCVVRATRVVSRASLCSEHVTTAAEPRTQEARSGLGREARGPAQAVPRLLRRSPRSPRSARRRSARSRSGRLSRRARRVPGGDGDRGARGPRRGAGRSAGASTRGGRARRGRR